MERNDSEDIKKHLMETNEQFREMARKHQEYDAQVTGVNDEIEEHRLKKLKLHLKDQMEEMVSRYRTQMA